MSKNVVQNVLGHRVYLFENIWFLYSMQVTRFLSELQIDEFKNKREEIMLGDFFSLFFFVSLSGPKSPGEIHLMEQSRDGKMTAVPSKKSLLL